MHWQKRTYTFLRREDLELTFFQDRSDTGTVSTKRRWLEAMVRSDSTIILMLGTLPVGQARYIIDYEERTAKYLWGALISLYTTSNEQAVINNSRTVSQ